MEKEEHIVEKKILDSMPSKFDAINQIIEEEKAYFEQWVKEREQKFLN